AAELGRRCGAVDASCRREDRSGEALRQHHRLIADQLRPDERAVAPRHDGHAARRAAVPARQDAGVHAARRQVARQPQRHRRLAGAADREVADADDRYRRLPGAQHAGPVPEPTQTDAKAEDATQRTQGEIAEAAGDAAPRPHGIAHALAQAHTLTPSNGASIAQVCSRASLRVAATARARAPAAAAAARCASNPSQYSASSLAVRTTTPPPAAHSAAAASATFSVCGPKATGLP